VRIHVTIDDDDLQERLGRALMNQARDYPMPAPEPDIKMGLNSEWGKLARKRTKRKRKLSTNPSAVRARKARAAKAKTAK